MKTPGQTLSANVALDGDSSGRLQRPSPAAAIGTAPDPQHLDAAAAASDFGAAPQADPEGGVLSDDGARSAGPVRDGAGAIEPVPNSELRIANSDDRIFAAEFARLYQLPSAAAARRFMRKNEVPHIASGRDLFTRASWLGSWEARRAKHLTPVEYTTPRETMLATAAAMVGELVRTGRLTLNPGRKLPA